MEQQLDETPISREEARDLIERNAGTVGLQWYLSLILLIAVAIAGVSLLTSPYPVSLSDYLAFLVLIVFVLLASSLLLTVHSKPVSFDRHGISIGWLLGEKEQYDWSQVGGLVSLPFVPGVAVLKLNDRKWWPIFMELDNSRHLNDAILIWKSSH